MKTIGLLGGMCWESAILYYRQINQGIKEHLGGLHSAKILLHSVDFSEIEACQSRGEWDKAGNILVHAARGLEKAGADGIILCSNTMHQVVPYIEAHCSLPVLHIADAAGQAIRAAGLQQIALLGTRYTMEQDVYRKRLKDAFVIRSIIPDEHQRIKMNQIIVDELYHGSIYFSSKSYCQQIIRELQDLGAEGVILGCTEIGLLLTEDDCPLPVFDTATLHVQAAIDFMLKTK